jgi:hypothetical protein
MSRRKKRKVKTTIHIVCEGKNTEPNYFRSIKESIEDEDEDYSYEINVYDSEKADAIGLVKEALTYLGEFSEVWAVFDKDGYTKHKEAFKLANSEGVNIAFSSIAFEHWVLLHFTKSKTAYTKSKSVIDYLIIKDFFPDYNKSSSINIYSTLKDKTREAIINAAWLRNEQEQALQTQAIYDINPYTDVDVFVKKLLQIDEEFIWGKISQRVEINSLFFSLDKIELQNGVYEFDNSSWKF